MSIKLLFYNNILSTSGAKYLKIHTQHYLRCKKIVIITSRWDLKTCNEPLYIALKYMRHLSIVFVKHKMHIF